MGKTPRELYEERNGRINDAIQLRTPDRIPLNLSFGYFPARYTGIPFSDAWYNIDSWLEANKKTVQDFEPDGLFFLQHFTPGKALEHLDLHQLRWPGYHLPENVIHQLIEEEWMKADEFDASLESMADYMMRVFYPRISGSLESLRMLPQISTLGFKYKGLLTLAEILARPEVAKAIAKLQKAGEEYAKVRVRMMTFTQEIEKLGFPVTGPGEGNIPFDTISVLLRGMQGAMTDLYRQPDKLQEFCDYHLEKIMDKIEVMTTGSVNRRVFFGLHRGSDGFLSIPQFKRFYWPALKQIITAFIDKGLIPCPFFEGEWDQRLEFLLEIPRGKMLCHFANTNLKRAKEVLGNHHCIMGTVPSFLLQTGSVSEVEIFCKELIDTCAGDGGFILSNMPMDYAKPENVQAMIKFTKKYGVYR